MAKIMGGGHPWRKGGRRKAEEVHERGDDLTGLIHTSVSCSKMFTVFLLNILPLAPRSCRDDVCSCGCCWGGGSLYSILVTNRHL